MDARIATRDARQGRRDAAAGGIAPALADGAWLGGMAGGAFALALGAERVLLLVLG